MQRLSFLAIALCLSSPILAQSAEEPTQETSGPSVDSSLLSSLELRPVGPAIMSGRIADVAVDPSNANIWYVAAGSGNLWKTTNSGTTWDPIFDDYPSYSIGCVTIDPTNSNVIWVGTGENVGGRHVGYGDGVYVSRDAGKSFENVGLSSSEHISKILVHPRNPNVVLVASQGPLWSPGGERGLYRSADGGKTWTQVLAAGEWTGCTDVVAEPTNPNIMYAVLHQRHRTVAALLNTGPESGIFKSVDGGVTWAECKKGLPSADMGKSALAVSPHEAGVVYATIELPGQEGGTWRSEDFGESWSKLSDFVSGGTGPHYYQEIWADPHRPECLYHANNYLSRSVDGGVTWENIEGDRKHVDNHAIAFHPSDSQFVLCGTDGGLYVSYDFAQTWQHMQNLPLTQFYKVDVDYDEPFYHVIGGTQDNSTQYGPIRTRDRSGIQSRDWIIPIGGDGHDNAINPENPDIIYCESQQGFIQRFDRRTGESISIRPASGDGEPELRFNWDSPILISPHQSNRVYIASNFLHRSDDHGDSWQTISPDLSRGENRLALPMMGRVHGVDAGYDLYAMSQYGNITSISESPVVENLLYVGTDDGLIHVSEDGGENWRSIDQIYGIPEKAFVNDIKADRHDPDTVYACLDNHKEGDYKPYLIKSTDRGRTWKLMVGDLPDRHLVWRFEQDHLEPNLMFLGTEFGLFVSIGAGDHWIKMEGGIPTIPIRDLAIQKREHDLVCATFGRGFYVLDDYSPLRELAKMKSEFSETRLFSPRETAWYVQTGVIPADSLGNDYFQSPNPPYGAVLTVYVSESYETARDQRKAEEKEQSTKGEDVDVPTFEELAAESAEQPAELMIEIRDEEDQLIRRVPCPYRKGLHRVVWDMRTSSPIASSPGLLAAPGTYRAQVVRVQEADVQSVGEAVEVALKPIFEPTIDPVSRQETTAFVQRAAKLRAVWSNIDSDFTELSEELDGRVQLIREAALDPTSLLEVAQECEELRRTLDLLLHGDEEKRSRDVLDVPTAGERLRTGLFQAARSSHGPTATSRQQVDIAEKGIEQASSALESLAEKVDQLSERMDAAGLIWVK